MPPRDRRLPETLLCQWLLVLLLGLGRAKAADLRPPCLVHPTQEAQPKAKRASKTVCFPSRTSSSSWRPSCLRRQSGDRRVISSEDLNASLRSLGVPSSLPRSLAGFGRSRSLSALSSRCLSLSHALHLRVRRSRHSPRGVWQLSWRERRTTARGGDGTPPADADERADGATTAPAPRPPLSPRRPPPLRAEAPVRHRTRAVYGAQRSPI